MSSDWMQLTIYMDETDMSGELPLYEVVVRRLLHLNLCGATVYRGIMGFGKHAKVHRQRLFGVPDDRPIVIVAVDREEPIRLAAADLRKLVREGLMTVAPVEVVELA